MRPLLNALPLALAVPFFSWPAAASDRLPVPDGIYFQDDEYCSKFRSGEFDMVEFEVEKDGRSIGLPESGCLIATVKEVRSNRFVVEADCLEFGEPWQYTFFLDVISPTDIRLDGEDLQLCRLEGPTGSQSHGAAASSAMTNDLAGLIDGWHDANEACRGGSGDDPATDQSCDVRESFSDRLDQLGYCYGRDGEHGYEHEWHKCGPKSLRP